MFFLHILWWSYDFYPLFLNMVYHIDFFFLQILNHFCISFSLSFLGQGGHVSCCFIWNIFLCLLIFLAFCVCFCELSQRATCISLEDMSLCEMILCVDCVCVKQLWQTHWSQSSCSPCGAEGGSWGTLYQDCLGGMVRVGAGVSQLGKGSWSAWYPGCLDRMDEAEVAMPGLPWRGWL